MDELHSAILEEYAAAPSDVNILGQALHSIDVNEDYLKEKNSYAWYYAIGKVIQPETIIEFGVRFGYSAIALCMGSGNNPDYVGVDNESYERGSNAWAQQFIKPLTSGCAVLFSRSAEAVIAATADLIHIDTGHTKEQALEDLEIAIQLLAEDGYILLDDIYHHPEVKAAADEFCEKHDLQFFDLPTFRGLRIMAA